MTAGAGLSPPGGHGGLVPGQPWAVPCPGVGACPGTRGLSCHSPQGRAGRAAEEGVRDVQRLWPCWAGLPVGLSVPEGPVFIYAHHVLPPGPLLLPGSVTSGAGQGMRVLSPEAPAEGGPGQGHPASLAPSPPSPCDSYTVSVCNNNKRKLNPTFYSAMFRL